MAPGLEPTRINDHILFLNLQHQLDPDWKLTVQAGYFNYTHQGTSLWPAAVNPDGTMIRSAGIWDAQSSMTLAQAFLNGKITTGAVRSEEHTSELQSLMRNSYAVFCLKKKRISHK